jgi:hypothetical protein
MERLRPEAEMALPSRDTGPVADYEQHRRVEAVKRILTALYQKTNALSYRAFSMHWIERKTIKKIAAELNVTQRVIRRRLCKAKRTFALLCEADREKDLLTDGLNSPITARVTRMSYVRREAVVIVDQFREGHQFGSADL